MQVIYSALGQIILEISQQVLNYFSITCVLGLGSKMWLELEKKLTWGANSYNDYSTPGYKTASAMIDSRSN